MIDNETEAHALIEALKQHLPMRAYARLPLVKALRGNGAHIEVNDPVTIDSVLYMGDEGGVACSIGLAGGKTVLVTSITHLRFDGSHPLASQIQAYQSRRTQRLEVADSRGPKRRGSKRSQTKLATKPKRKKARPASDVPPTGVASSKTPRRFPRAELHALPLRSETWQVGLRPHGDEPSAQPPRDHAATWLFAVANVDQQEMRALTVIDQPLTECVVWNQLVESFLCPMEGDPALPVALVVSRAEYSAAWEPLLAEIGVRCRYESEPQPVGQLLEAMGRELAKRELPPAEGLDIREFPQSDAVWQADFFRSPAWVDDEQKGPYRPWSVLVMDKAQSIVLSTSHTPDDPTPEMLLEFLVRTMARPAGSEPQRPRLVELSNSDCYDYLRPRLEAAGVACRLVDEMAEFNDFCLRLSKTFDGSPKCSLADGPGVTRAHMESFYDAAAYYFRQAPWRHVPGEVPIEIRCDDPAMGTRFAIVLGRTGLQLGLCIHDNWEITQAMLAGQAAPDDSRALVVCYDDAQIMSAVDLQLIDRLGWPIAAPEAWPAVMRLEPQRTPRSASADELVFLDACLRAIPGFLKGKANSPTQQVQTGAGSVQLYLSWAGR